MSSEEEKNYIDTFIKYNIEKGIKIVYHTLQGSHTGKRMCYYTGYLHKDILDNFPGRTSKKIFRGYREFLNNERLIFTQKKFEDSGYDYYVEKVRYVKIK